MSDRRMLGVIDRSVESVTVTRAQAWYLDWSVDILIYTLVLNLFVEYVDGVVIDSFTISILTAVLLKVVLVLLTGAEQRIHGYFGEKGTAGARVIGAVLIFGVLFGGKLLILEVVDVVFGDEVDLGHFVEVVALILCMMVARRLMDWTFDRLGTGDEPAAAADEM